MLQQTASTRANPDTPGCFFANSRRSAERHVAALAIAAAHQLGIVSSDEFERLEVADKPRGESGVARERRGKGSPVWFEELELDCKPASHHTIRRSACRLGLLMDLQAPDVAIVLSRARPSRRAGE
ncbi:hypothetical protein JCM24511_01401 [Saitozyma sp. JCM 24511]|nr:hypothetical protein JCM24511_01401 [Saitozyma sp. JCM 24511]